MRQSSDKFMDAMLEDISPPAEQPNIAEILDKKIDDAMKKFTEQLTQSADNTEIPADAELEVIEEQEIEENEREENSTEEVDN